LQPEQVEIDIIYSDAEDEILKVLLAKWARHNEMTNQMSEIIKKYGLSSAASTTELKRSIGVERQQQSGQGWKAVHNDCVPEVMDMADNSVGMVLTSIPFSDQYEYCESYNDMGHNDGNEGFFEQLGFLIPELLRVLQPGRVAAIHVKDRIRFSYQNGVGFTSLIDFSGQTVAAFEKHGFHLLGKHFIPTDVVAENNQTYRLGWTEQCKDGTKMGCGSPEYLLVFRKAPTDQSNAYADVPVVKSKETYTRGRWQLDAHAEWLTSGERLLKPEELRKLDLSQIGKAWGKHCETTRYDYQQHLAISEQLDEMGKLSAKFMTLQPKSKSEWVWYVNRMRTLNANQAGKKKEKHVCPLQFDIIDRAITRYSNEGDVVLDPFGGLMSVPYRCIPANRYGIGIELNPLYWKDGVMYCREAEYKQHNVPTLFNQPAPKSA
jgi:DNA modification methylase